MASVLAAPCAGCTRHMSDIALKRRALLSLHRQSENHERSEANAHFAFGRSGAGPCRYEGADPDFRNRFATIREAASYDDAVEAIKREVFDIVFLDIDLKGHKNGLDFLRYIRSLDLDTRAIMLSGRSEKEIIMTCIEAGASGYSQRWGRRWRFPTGRRYGVSREYLLADDGHRAGRIHSYTCRRTAQNLSRIDRRDRPCAGGPLLPLPRPA